MTIAIDMNLARWSLILPIVWGLQVAAPDPSPPTALEQALIEHVCSATRAPGVVESGAYRECLSLKLLSIRADFGRDLSRLSPSERRTIDSVCSKSLEAREREAYLECLSGQLIAMSSRRSRATPGTSAATPSPSPPPVTTPPASPPPPASQTSSSLSGLWIGVVVVSVLVAAGAVLLVKKARRAPSKCRVCGVVDVPQPGALCQQCRREAADAARRAATERVDHERAQLEELRQQKAREEEEARLRDQEQARQREEEVRQQEHEASQREEEAGRRGEEIGQSSQADVTVQGGTVQEVFDPYAILGVSRDASQQEIRAAYDEAKLKYDLDHVAHHGPELQEHFKAKAQAVDRAYQMLTG